MKLQTRAVRIATVIILCAQAAAFFAACEESGPLYGTWADNKGNSFSFYNENNSDKFNARIAAVSVDSLPLNYSGNFYLLLNVLTLDCKEMGIQIVTEWDIRGNVLRLDWVNPTGEIVSLTLFKTKN
ncbi:MAG: hypothetical protein LBH20_09425 [Treponema sp.]|jgi:hypothetical protein|nr:hypothetical protein [Treponema sp.]